MNSNDLDLIHDLGPEPTHLDADVMASARARLESAIAAPATPSATDRPTLAAPTPLRRRRRAFALVGVAAAAAAAVALVPPMLSDDGVALAAVDPLQFPVTATWLPAGLTTDPVISVDPDFALAVYGSGNTDIVTVIAPDSEDHWEAPSDPDAVDINGRDGEGFARTHTSDEGTTPTYTIHWEQADGDVIGVTGRGRYADPETVERIADSVTEQRQPVSLFLTVAPGGWSVYGYQSDHHISYGDEGELAVALVSELNPGLAAYGAREVTAVEVDGRPGELGRVDAERGGVGWILETTAPDGRAFSLQAPPELTRDQVLAVAAGVRHR